MLNARQQVGAAHNSTQKISHCSMAMSDEYKIITAGKMKLTVHVHVKWYQFSAFDIRYRFSG